MHAYKYMHAYCPSQDSQHDCRELIHRNFTFDWLKKKLNNIYLNWYWRQQHIYYITVRKVDLLCTHKRLAVVVHKVCGVIATTNTVPGCQPITRVLIYKTWECQIKDSSDEIRTTIV